MIREEKIALIIIACLMLVSIFFIFFLPEKQEKHHIILLDGTEITCNKMDGFPCGFTLSECSDAQEHICTNNFSVKEK